MVLISKGANYIKAFTSFSEFSALNGCKNATKKAN